jgi:hypothetical protein
MLFSAFSGEFQNKCYITSYDTIYRRFFTLGVLLEEQESLSRYFKIHPVGNTAPLKIFIVERLQRKVFIFIKDSGSRFIHGYK